MKLLIVNLLVAVFLALSDAKAFSSRISAIDHDEPDVMDGYYAENGQFPHMCSLANLRPNGIITVCGASFISEYYLLTVAHCMTDVIASTAGCGTVDLGRPYLHITTHSYTQHPDYDPSTLSNNIALWNSPIGVIFNARVSPISLPSMTTPMCLNGEKTTLTGFGRNHTEAGNYSRKMRYVYMRVISNEDCEKIYGDVIVTPSTLCAVGHEAEHHSSCDGDGGSPLTVMDDGVEVQIGIASFTHSTGCESGMPQGYVRTAPYLPWIRNMTGIAIRH